MKVYFVRHGESNQNITLQYQLDTDKLSQEGLRQAESVAHRFRTIDVDAVITSNKTRTRETAEAISKVTGKKVEVSELFNERKRPSEFTGRGYFEPEMVTIKQNISKNSHDPNWRHSDEETMTEIITRAKQCISFLEKRKDGAIVVVSHSAFIKCIIACMMFGDEVTPALVEHLYHFMITRNAGITLCEKLVNRDTEQLKWHLITWSDQAHLG